MSEVSLLLQSAVAAGLSNVDSRRFRNPSLDNRTESWTEIWGDEKPDVMEEAMIADQLATVHPQLPVTLFQFRPAWAEQLVLKIAKIPYVVINSRYAATESTGSLPYLRDLSNTNSNRAPALVGKYQPSGKGPSETNAILEYLHKSSHSVNLDGAFNTPQQAAQSHLLANLIRNELGPMLDALRFEDTDAWEQIYRPQYLDASRGRHGCDGPGFFAVGSWWQTWSIRAVARKALLAKGWTLDRAKTTARPSYATLETFLENQTYLLGTPTPSTVDCMLFEHLAEALCNVHLVIILADFPKLVQFFQTLYETHFGLADDNEWSKWNRQENLVNAFQTLPIETKQGGTSDRPFKNALELMQSLSVHQHNLQEVLVVMKQKRDQETRPIPIKECSTLYRWRMGDDLMAKSSKTEEDNNKTKDETDETTTQQSPQEKWRKDQKYSDEVWISAVFVVSLAVIGNAMMNVSSKSSK
jgi:glutathione S-transferase